MPQGAYLVHPQTYCPPVRAAAWLLLIHQRELKGLCILSSLPCRLIRRFNPTTGGHPSDKNVPFFESDCGEAKEPRNSGFTRLTGDKHFQRRLPRRAKQWRLCETSHPRAACFHHEG